jgi:hypothetical protein
MRKTVDRALDRIVYAGVRLTVRFQATAFSLLALAFGIKRLGRAYQTLMQSREVGQMAAAVGCPEVPDRMVAVIESKLNPRGQAISMVPDPPSVIDAEFLDEHGVVFESGPYRVITTMPPDDTCPFWRFEFVGPGFEPWPNGKPQFAFIGCTESCGESHMGALGRAFAAGHASAPARVEDSCQTR